MDVHWEAWLIFTAAWRENNTVWNKRSTGVSKGDIDGKHTYQKAFSKLTQCEAWFRSEVAFLELEGVLPNDGTFSLCWEIQNKNLVHFFWNSSTEKLPHGMKVH